MKRVVLVLSLLVMSIFVSGYTYNVDMTITDDSKLYMNKTFKMEKAEITKAVCGPIEECEYDEFKVREAVSKYVNSDVTSEGVKKEDKVNITADTVEISYKYNLGDLDDYVGAGKEQFDLIYSNFNRDLFTIDGLKYKSNISFAIEDEMTSGTFTLKLPGKATSSNSQSKDDNTHTYKWNLKESPVISFVYKVDANKEIEGDKEYGKIKFNKYMFIGIGVVIGLIVILSFVNIIKKDKEKEVATVETPQENTTVYNSEVFNERAAVTKPSDIAEGEDTFQRFDESQHEDKISNKFMDDSFAGTTTVEEMSVPEEPKAEKVEEPMVISDSKIEEPKVESVFENEEANTNKNEEEPSSPPIGNDMSSVAFGGAPIDDKNINEIE